MSRQYGPTVQFLIESAYDAYQMAEYTDFVDSEASIERMERIAAELISITDELKQLQEPQLPVGNIGGRLEGDIFPNEDF